LQQQRLLHPHDISKSKARASNKFEHENNMFGPRSEKMPLPETAISRPGKTRIPSQINCMEGRVAWEGIPVLTQIDATAVTSSIVRGRQRRQLHFPERG
jgi:hypothetical protein